MVKWRDLWLREELWLSFEWILVRLLTRASTGFHTQVRTLWSRWVGHQMGKSLAGWWGSESHGSWSDSTWVPVVSWISQVYPRTYPVPTTLSVTWKSWRNMLSSSLHGGPVKLRGRAAIQRDWDGVEEWNRNLMKLNKDKCQGLHLWRKKPWQWYKPGAAKPRSSSVERT